MLQYQMALSYDRRIVSYISPRGRILRQCSQRTTGTVRTFAAELFLTRLAINWLTRIIRAYRPSFTF